MTNKYKRVFVPEVFHSALKDYANAERKSMVQASTELANELNNRVNKKRGIKIEPFQI